MEHNLRDCLRSFYLGDAYGANYDANAEKERGETMQWTENGDIVAVVANACITRADETIPSMLSRWAHMGLPQIEKPAKGLSTVAQRIMTDPAWKMNPNAVAKKTVGDAPQHIVNINLPVSTSIVLLLHDNRLIVEHALSLSHDPLTASAAVFYIEVLRMLIFGQGQHMTPEDIIGTIAPSVPVMLPNETLCEYSRANLAELDLGTRPHFVMTTIKVICYALRVVYYANQNGKIPDIVKILAHITSVANSDASTNCAVALSVIRAGCHNVRGFDDMWGKIEHKEWIDDVIVKLVNTWRIARSAAR